MRSWLAFVRLKEGRAELFVCFFPSHVGGAGHGQRCIGNAEKASTRTDGERNPGFFGSSFPPHSLRAFRDLAVLVSGHGILLRRGLALTQTKTNWQMLHRYGSQVSSPSTSSLPLPLSLPNCSCSHPKIHVQNTQNPICTQTSIARALSRSLVRLCERVLSLSLSSSLDLVLSKDKETKERLQRREIPFLMIFFFFCMLSFSSFL